MIPDGSLTRCVANWSDNWDSLCVLYNFPQKWKIIPLKREKTASAERNLSYLRFTELVFDVNKHTENLYKRRSLMTHLQVTTKSQHDNSNNVYIIIYK